MQPLFATGKGGTVGERGIGEVEQSLKNDDPDTRANWRSGAWETGTHQDWSTGVSCSPQPHGSGEGWHSKPTENFFAKGSFASGQRSYGMGLQHLLHLTCREHSSWPSILGIIGKWMYDDVTRRSLGMYDLVCRSA